MQTIISFSFDKDKIQKNKTRCNIVEIHSTLEKVQAKKNMIETSFHHPHEKKYLITYKLVKAILITILRFRGSHHHFSNSYNFLFMQKKKKKKRRRRRSLCTQCGKYFTKATSKYIFFTSLFIPKFSQRHLGCLIIGTYKVVHLICQTLKLPFNLTRKKCNLKISKPLILWVCRFFPLKTDKKILYKKQQIVVCWCKNKNSHYFLSIT